LRGRQSGAREPEAEPCPKKNRAQTPFLVSISAILTPILMPSIFGYFSGDNAPVYFPGAPYLAATVLLGLSIVLFGVLHRPAAPKTV